MTSGNKTTETIGSHGENIVDGVTLCDFYPYFVIRCIDTLFTREYNVYDYQAYRILRELLAFRNVSRKCSKSSQ